MGIKKAGFVLRPERVVGALAFAAALLAVASFIGQIVKFQYGVERAFGLIHQLDLNAEDNCASWFSAALLLVCGLLLWVIALARRGMRQPALQWSALAVIFGLLSADEIASLHERSMRYISGWLHADGFLFYPWVVFGAVFALAVFVAYIPFLMRLDARTRFLFVLSGAIYLTGALGFEMISARYASLHSENNLTFAAMAHVEECLELAGSILFIYALLDYLRRHLSPITVQLQPTRSAVERVFLSRPLEVQPHGEGRSLMPVSQSGTPSAAHSSPVAVGAVGGAAHLPSTTS